MNKIMKGIAALGAASVIALTGCATQAETVDHNLDQSAENFEIMRRVVFINTITDSYMLEVQGLCNLTPRDGRILVTCKIEEGNDDDSFIRHMIYSGDNTAVVVEQLEAADVDPFHYRFIFRPETIVPDFDIETSQP